MALQIPYDLFMEQLHRSKEIMFSERQSFFLPKASHIKVCNVHELLGVRKTMGILTQP